jgi:hypothetical protein
MGVCVLIVVVSGAAITSSQEIQSATNSMAVRGGFGLGVHEAVGFAALGLTFGLGAWLWGTRRSVLRGMAVEVVILAGVDTWIAISPPLSPGIASLHAWLAACFFGSLVSIAPIVPHDASRSVELVDDRGLPFLRPLAILTPLLVLLQAGLGARAGPKPTHQRAHLAPCGR